MQIMFIYKHKYIYRIYIYISIYIYKYINMINIYVYTYITHVLGMSYHEPTEGFVTTRTAR